MSVTAVRGGIYFGSYDPEKRFEEMGAYLARLLGLSSKRPDLVIEPPKLEFKEEDKDPLKTNLEKKRTDLEKLKEDADNYKEEHVNQEFRRIYATAQKLQLELDRVDLQGRDDAKALKRQCIILANRICDNILMGKLHREDCSNCSTCLPIA